MIVVVVVVDGVRRKKWSRVGIVGWHVETMSAMKLGELACRFER